MDIMMPIMGGEEVLRKLKENPCFNIPVIALTMVIIIMLGSIIGMLLPFIFTRLKLDPATASAPLITTICDISGVLIYFSMAKIYLGL